MPSYVDERPLDAIIIGAGFGGCYLLRNLRKQGFRARIFEEGQGLGGVWWHNRYPGTRVDTDIPFYEFSDPEIWSEWHWSERYPGQPELSRYFDFVDSKWDLSKDISFGSFAAKMYIPHSRASTASRASSVTRPRGPRSTWTSPASASASSGPAPPACSSSRSWGRRQGSWSSPSGRRTAPCPCGRRCCPRGSIWTRAGTPSCSRK